MQGDVVVTVRAGVLQCVLIELLSDMLSAGPFVHAQVVDIQCADPGAKRTFLNLLTFTEDISEDLICIVRKDKDRVFFCLNLLLKLFAGILGGRTLEQIRADHVVHHVHLCQQTEDVVDIFSFGKSDAHLNLHSAAFDRRHAALSA